MQTTHAKVHFYSKNVSNLPHPFTRIMCQRVVGPIYIQPLIEAFNESSQPQLAKDFNVFIIIVLYCTISMPNQC